MTGPTELLNTATEEMGGRWGEETAGQVVPPTHTDGAPLRVQAPRLPQRK